MAPLIYGFLTFFSSIPSPGRLKALAGWNMKWLVTVQAAVGRTGLHFSVLVVVIVFVGMQFSFVIPCLGDRFMPREAADRLPFELV